jgi:hypothetical protein
MDTSKLYTDVTEVFVISIKKDLTKHFILFKEK